MMQKYTINTQLLAEQFDGKTMVKGMARFCSTCMINTSRGMIKIYKGDYIIRTNNDELFMLPGNFFERLISKEDNNGDK